MTMPTAAQIEADVARPTYVVERYTGGSWVDVSSDVVEVAGALESSAGDGLSFGLAPDPSCDIRVAAAQFSAAWDRTPVRIKFGYNSANPQYFLGLIDGVDQAQYDGTWQALGFTALFEAEEIRTPLYYRRPVATATTATSLEDPDNAGYQGGLINTIFWRCGFRPAAQAASYPSAVAYYACETAILAPDWSWLNGGDARQALDQLCKAAGGIIYQGADGVVRYQEPFTFGAGTPTFGYTDAALTAAQRVAQSKSHWVAGSLRRSLSTSRRVCEVVRCNFVKRRLQGEQEIYKDSEPRLVEAGATLTLDLDLQLPCYRVGSVTAVAGTIHTAQEVTAAQLTIARTATYAQRLRITLTNTLSEPLNVYDLVVTGQPLLAGEEGSASYGTATGSTPRNYAVPDSPYIQSRAYAERLAWLYWDFLSAPRPVVELSAAYDPRRTLGEVVTLTVASWGYSSVPHRIGAIRVSRTGRVMDLSLVPVSGLPVAADFFQLGTSYADGTSRQLAY